MDMNEGGGEMSVDAYTNHNHSHHLYHMHSDECDELVQKLRDMDDSDIDDINNNNNNDDDDDDDDMVVGNCVLNLGFSDPCNTAAVPHQRMFKRHASEGSLVSIPEEEDEQLNIRSRYGRGSLNNVKPLPRSSSLGLRDAIYPHEQQQPHHHRHHHRQRCWDSNSDDLTYRSKRPSLIEVSPRFESLLERSYMKDSDGIINRPPLFNSEESRENMNSPSYRLLMQRRGEGARRQSPRGSVTSLGSIGSATTLESITEGGENDFDMAKKGHNGIHWVQNHQSHFHNAIKESSASYSMPDLRRGYAAVYSPRSSSSSMHGSASNLDRIDEDCDLEEEEVAQLHNEYMAIRRSMPSSISLPNLSM